MPLFIALELRCCRTFVQPALGRKHGLLRHPKLERREIIRNTLRVLPEAEEIETAGDSFLLVFSKPSDAVRFALLTQARLRVFSAESRLLVQERMGIHLGEVVISEHETEVKAKDLYGLQLATCARVMSLAQGAQILLTRGVFNSARQVLKGEDIPGVGRLSWVSHGPYVLKGIEEAVEVCEVGEVGQSPLAAPKTSEKAQRQVRPDEEPVLGWRPAVGQEVPNTKWVLEEKLGEGGFGEVWKARHEKLKEFRVFKFCFRADRVRSLKREVTLFRLLKERSGEHPNIVRLHDIYFDQPPFYLEEEYVEGKDLKSWCEAQGGIDKVPQEVRLEIIAQAAEGLQAAHDAGIIHRDVKPGNILVSGEWQVTSNENRGGPGEVTSPRSSLATRHSPLVVKLTDFGIGQVISAEYLAGVTKAGFTQTMLGSTSSGTGTTMYLAPEIVAGMPATTRSDIYSLGVVLYQLLLGDFRRPLATDWAKGVADPLLREDLQQCFAGEPNDRFAGAAQAARSFRSLEQRRVASVERDRLQRSADRRRTLALVSTLAVAVLLLVAAALLYGLRRTQAQALIAERNVYAVDMLLGFRAQEDGNRGALTRLLGKYLPWRRATEGAASGTGDQRGWEWRHLWHRSLGEGRIVLAGHSNVVTFAGILADQRTIVSVGRDRALRFWDSQGGVVLETLHVPEQPACGALSADRRYLFVGGEYGYWGLYDPNRRALLFAQTNAAPVRGGAFSSDGRRLAVLAANVAEVWGLPDFQLRRRIARQVSEDFRFGVALTADGQRVAYSYGSDVTGPNRLSVFDVERGTETVLGELSQGGALSLCFTLGDRQLVSGDRSGVSVWDIDSRQLVRRLTNHLDQVVSVALSPDGRRLASTGLDQTVRLWDTGSWTELRLWKGHELEVFSVTFSADGKSLISCGKDEGVRVWDVDRPARQAVEQFSWGPGSYEGGWAPRSPTVPRQLRIVYTNNVPAEIAFFDVLRLAAQRLDAGRLKLEPGDRLAGVGGDLRSLVVTRRDGAIEVWDTEPVIRIQRIEPKPSNPEAIALGSTSRWLAVERDSGETEVYAVGHSTPVKALPRLVPWAARTGQFFPRLSFWSRDTRLVRVRPESKEAPDLIEVQLLPEGRATSIRSTHRDWVNNFALSEDGTMAATTAWDEQVKLWDVRSGRELHTFRSPLGNLVSAAFSPDGRRLVAGGWDGTVTIWDLASHLQVAHWKAHARFVSRICFLEGDTILMTGSPSLRESRL